MEKRGKTTDGRAEEREGDEVRKGGGSRKRKEMVRGGKEGERDEWMGLGVVPVPG